MNTKFFTGFLFVVLLSMGIGGCGKGPMRQELKKTTVRDLNEGYRVESSVETIPGSNIGLVKVTRLTDGRLFQALAARGDQPKIGHGVDAKRVWYSHRDGKMKSILVLVP